MYVCHQARAASVQKGTACTAIMPSISGMPVVHSISAFRVAQLWSGDDDPAF